MIPHPDAPQLVAGLLIAVSPTLLLYRARGGRVRLRGVSVSATHTRPGRAPRWVRLVGPLAGIAVALLISGWFGLLVGAVVGYAVDRAVRRMEPRAERRQREQAQAALPYVLDLTAAALSSGAPPAVAASEVGTAIGGLLGARLVQVGSALALGAASDEAWAALGSVPNGARFAAVMVRGSQTGAALSRSLRRLADDLRSARLADLEAATHRAGVFVVLPLGLCFLPAFVAGGLIPVVVSMLGTVLP